MIKRIFLTSIIALFLLLQGFSTVHSASHNTENNHKHSGKICDICLSSAQAKLTPNAELFFLDFQKISFEIDFFEEKNLILNFSNNFHPRAPPIFS